MQAATLLTALDKHNSACCKHTVLVKLMHVAGSLTFAHVVPEGLGRAEEGALDAALPQLLARIGLDVAWGRGAQAALQCTGKELHALAHPWSCRQRDTCQAGAAQTHSELSQPTHPPVSSQNPALLMPMKE